MADNRCVCCGEIIPEGMIACPNCLVAVKKLVMPDCDSCLFSRIIVSENGIHGACVLSAKAAKDCLMGIKPRYRRCVWSEEAEMVMGMRLIDADKLDWWYKGRPIRRVIDEAPTVDAVPVVRCKDCKYYMTIHCTCDGCCISDDWYCADGERKDNDL